MAGQPLTIDEARRLVIDTTAQIARTRPEQVQIAQALDRVLAQDLLAAGPVPAFPSSAMDGYAIRACPAGNMLHIVGESRAGSPAAAQITAADQAIRISTGAAVPDGADAVIRQEDTEATETTVRTTAATQPGDNVREVGEDLQPHEKVLDKGALIGPGQIGAAVAAGLASLTVAARPTVTILCTGDELRPPGEALKPGEIHSSNEFMLAALLHKAGASITASHRIEDDQQATIDAIAQALETSDVTVITGGVSVGPHDHVKPALTVNGVTERFWRVRLQPGGPTWFGTKDNRIVFGLPGNPVSAFVTCALFVIPAIDQLTGRTPRPGQGTATLGQAVKRNPNREQAIRVRVNDGVATPTGPQGSHLTTSLAHADALAMIPQGDGQIEAGATVTTMTLSY
jgi:molybdopterin molybdotransferase